MITRKVQIPVLIRSAKVVPNTYNEENRTVEITWSTGARVLRMPFFDDPFMEELDMSPEACDLSRLNDGAPFLSVHRSDDLSDVLGVMVRAWLQEGMGRGLVRFSKRASIQETVDDIVDGIIRNVSVGYNVSLYRDVTGPNDKFTVLRAVRWQPLECSAVPIGADAGAGFRSHSDSVFPCEILSPGSDPSIQQSAVSAKERGDSMPPEIENPASPATPAATATSAPAAAAQRSEMEIKKEERNAERSRVTEIMSSCRKAGLPENFSEKLIADGTPIDEARKAIIDELAERQSAGGAVNPHAVSASGGMPVKEEQRHAAATEALLHRADPMKYKLTDIGRDFRGMNLAEMAAEFLQARGVRTRGMFKAEIAKRAFESTSDFPALLANVANKSLRDAYQNAPQSFRPIVKVATAPDFKQMSRVQLSDAPSLEVVNESGEIKRGAVTDGKEVYQIVTAAKRIGLTRQTIINDDLQAFTRLPMLFGRAAADYESDVVWGIITANAAMGDGVALFHATHKNLASPGTVLDVPNTAAARQAMRKQLNLQKRPMRVEPKFYGVSPENETAAEQVVGPIVPNAAGSFNPFSGKLQILVEPRLSVSSGAQPWYTFADPSQIDIIEICYLEGQQGVVMENKMSSDIDGMELICKEDFGAKALDFRGMYKNPGT